MSSKLLPYITLFFLMFPYFTFAQAGKPDPSFGNEGKMNINFNKGISEFHTVALQKDGKIVFAGSAGNDFLIVRLNPDGSLDNGFGNGGHVIVPLLFTYDIPQRVLVQPDGKILICGEAGLIGYKVYTSEGLIVRLNPNGSLDSSFDGDGYKMLTPIPYSSAAHDMVLESNGKIIVLLKDADLEFTKYAVTRLNTDGSIDSTWNDTYNGSTFAPSKLLIQQNAKIILTGTAQDTSSKSFYFSSLRFNPDASPDNTFDGDGKADIPMNSGNGYAFGASVQADGKIIIAGYGDAGKPDKDFYVARLNPDGSIDNSFDGDGKVFAALSDQDDIAYAVMTHANGKIALLGTSFKGIETNVAMVQLNQDGSLDVNFDGDGKMEFQVNTAGNDLVTTGDGKIIIATVLRTTNTSPAFAHLAGVFQLNQNGSFDNSFSNDGKEFFEFGKGDDQCIASALQNDGKLLVAGSSFKNGENDNFSIARINDSGNLDNTFGSNGKLQINWGANQEYCTDIEVKANGKILAAGVIDGPEHNIAIAQLNADGTFDNSFASNGKLTIPLAEHPSLVKLAIQPDQKIILSSQRNNNNSIVIRLNNDGSFDNSFDGDGKRTVILYLTDIALQTDGKIVLAGHDLGNFKISRLNSDGSLDPGFDQDGEAIFDLGGLDEVYEAVIQPDGKIVLGGHSNYNPILIRLNADGSLDNGFDGDGIVTTPFGNILSQMITGLAIGHDAKILAGGIVYGNNTVPSSHDYVVLKLNADGSYDQSFNGNGIAEISSPFDEYLSDLEIDQKGRIVLSGTDMHARDYHIVRLMGNEPTAVKFDELQANHVKLYPNPAQGKFTFYLPSDITSNGYSIRIYNSTGHMVYLNQHANDVMINLQGNSTGLYHVLIENGKEQYKAKLILE